MASYFVRTKEVPPGSGNSYCYVVKEENGEQKQEYVGPTKDIDIQNWNPTSLKEEPPTDYEPGEGMSTDVREVYDQLYEESLDMDNIPESVRHLKYDKSGKHVGVYNDGMTLLVIVPVTDDKFEEIKDANDADEFDISRLHSHNNTVELPKINFNEARGKELFFLDDSDNPDNKGFNAFNFELLKQASRVENKGSYKNTSLAGNNLEYEKPNQPVLLHSSRYDYLFPPITPEGGTFDDREFRSVLEDKDEGEFMFFSDEYGSYDDYVSNYGSNSESTKTTELNGLNDVKNVIEVLHEEKLDIEDEKTEIKLIREDKYKEGYYVNVYGPEATVGVLMHVDEETWEEIEGKGAEVQRRSPEDFLSDNNSVEIPKINLNDGKDSRVALFDEDGDNMFNWNAFSFYVLEKASRVSRGGSYKNTELKGATLKYDHQEYPTILETSEYDYVFAPVIIEDKADDANEDFLRYIANDSDSDWILLSDQYDSLDDAAEGLDDAVEGISTKAEDLPKLEWEYTPNSTDKRARNLESKEISDLKPSQQEDWYSESELREENWIEENVENNDEGFYPIPVVYRNGGYMLQDGHHRVSYAKLKGRTNVIVETGYEYEYKLSGKDKTKTQRGYEFINRDDEKIEPLHYKEREEELRKGVEEGKLQWVKKDGKMIFGSSSSSKTRIYGRSDDLVYIDGEDKEEIGAYNTDVWIEIGGLTVKLEYAYSWSISIIQDDGDTKYELEDNGKDENDVLIIEGTPAYDHAFNVEDLNILGDEANDSQLAIDDNWELMVDSGTRYVWKSQTSADEFFVSWHQNGNWTTVDFNEGFSLPKTGYPERGDVEELRVNLETESDIVEFLESNRPAEVLSMTAAESLGENRKDIDTSGESSSIDEEEIANQLDKELESLYKDLASLKRSVKNYKKDGLTSGFDYSVYQEEEKTELESLKDRADEITRNSNYRELVFSDEINMSSFTFDDIRGKLVFAQENLRDGKREEDAVKFKKGVKQIGKSLSAISDTREEIKGADVDNIAIDFDSEEDSSEENKDSEKDLEGTEVGEEGADENDSELTIEDTKDGKLGTLRLVMATEKGQSFADLQKNTGMSDEDIKEGLNDLKELDLIYERKPGFYNWIGEDKTKEEHQKEIEGYAEDTEDTDTTKSSTEYEDLSYDAKVRVGFDDKDYVASPSYKSWKMRIDSVMKLVRHDDNWRAAKTRNTGRGRGTKKVQEPDYEIVSDEFADEIEEFAEDYVNIVNVKPRENTVELASNAVGTYTLVNPDLKITEVVERDTDGSDGDNSNVEEEKEEPIETEDSKSYAGIGGGRREKLDNIEEFDRLKQLEESDVESIEDIRDYIEDMKLSGVAYAKGSSVDLNDLLDRLDAMVDDLPNEEAERAYANDKKLFRTLRSSRRHFNKLVDKEKSFASMPSPMESGPANYPTGKRDKKRNSLKKQKDKVEEKIDRLYGRLKGARQRALNEIGTSVGEQNEKKRANTREDQRERFEKGMLAEFFHGPTSYGRIKRVNKKSTTFEYWRNKPREEGYEFETVRIDMPSSRYTVVEDVKLSKDAVKEMDEEAYNLIMDMDASDVPEEMDAEFVRQLKQDKQREEIEELKEEAYEEKNKREEEDKVVKVMSSDGDIRRKEVTASSVDSFVDAVKNPPHGKTRRIYVEGEEVFTHEDVTEGMDENKDAVKELTSQGAMIGKDAADIITDLDVERIEGLDVTPMYISDTMIEQLRRSNTEIDLSDIDDSRESDNTSEESTEESSGGSDDSGYTPPEDSKYSEEELEEARQIIYAEDDGDGASFKKLVQDHGLTEDIMDFLKQLGDAYEPKPGYLKLIDYDGDSLKEKVFGRMNDRDYRKYKEGPKTFAFRHDETEKDLWFERRSDQDEGTWFIYGDIVRILKQEDVINYDGPASPEKHYDDKQDALDDLEIFAMAFNNDYKEYVDGYGDDVVDESSVEEAEDEILEILNNSEDVEYEKIKKRIDRPEDVLEEAVNNLLSDGTAYEPKPGSIQKL